MYLFDLALVKFSILWFYRAISSERIYRRVIYAVTALVAVFTISMIFINAFECPNPSDAWSIEILLQGKGSCNDLHQVYFIQAGINIASDVIILLLPMPILARVQMKRNKRIAMILIFSCGAISVVASCARLYGLHLWATSSDVPYVGAYILIWSQVEINVAIIAPSIPTIKPLVAQYFSSFKTRAASSAYLRYGYNPGSSANDKSKTGFSVTTRSLGYDGLEDGVPLRGMTRAINKVEISSPKPINTTPERSFRARSEGQDTLVAGSVQAPAQSHWRDLERGDRPLNPPLQITRVLTVETRSEHGLSSAW